MMWSQRVSTTVQGKTVQAMSTPTDILVVAAPNEARGAALADALRQLGRSVTLATTPDVAAQAARYAGTIVTLTPATRDDPAVQAAINAQPSRMVGFFPEPMILPFGKWSNDPVLLRDSLPDAAARLVAALEAPLKEDVAAEARAARERKEAQAKQRQLITYGIVGAVIVVLVILTVIGVHSINANIASSQAAAPDTPTPAPTSVPLPSYSASLLGKGAGCDTGHATWHVVPTSLTKTCAKGQGTLLATTQATNALQELAFVPPAGTFPAAYSVSVKATFVSGDANVYAFVGVLGQTSHNSQQLCAVNMAAMWQGGEVGITGAYKAQQHGALPNPLTTATLGAVLHSNGTVTCAIDGKQVGKPFTSTLSSSNTYQLFVGMFDVGSTGPFSVSFTSFKYVPVNS
jgi:hypothetical protein